MRSGRGSLTARLTAACRHMGDADPYAARFVGPGLRPILPLARRLDGPLNALTLGLVHAVRARHAWIDAQLQRAVGQGARQVVLLGAGFDSRPWRLPLGGVPVFTCDHPDTAAARRAAAHGLPPRSVDVPVDFARADFAQALLDAGFAPDRPAVFVWEGVSMYLSPAAVAQTFARVRALSGGGGWLLFDAWCSTPSPLRAGLERVGMRGLGWLGEPMGWTPTIAAVQAAVEGAGLTLAAHLSARAVAGAGRAHAGLRLFEAVAPALTR